MTDVTLGRNEPSRGSAALKLVVYSFIGIFFFVPVTIGGKSTILLDHAATAIATQLRPAALVFVCLLIAYGAFGPFVTGTWKRV